MFGFVLISNVITQKYKISLDKVVQVKNMIRSSNVILETMTTEIMADGVRIDELIRETGPKK
jgi:hypothetical protein